MVLKAPKEKISLGKEEPQGVTPWFQYPTLDGVCVDKLEDLGLV